MSKKVFWGIIIGIIVFATLAATRSAWMNIDNLTFLRSYIKKVNILPDEKNLTFEKSCSACHTLYAPGLLPARSWKVMMSGLSNHFGDNAEMEAKNRDEVSAYLQRNAADVVENIYSEQLLLSIKPDESPLRFTDTSYFKLLHDIVHPDMVIGNPDVKSIARCDVCHKETLEGRYNRFAVQIPNYYKEGVWKKGVARPYTEGENTGAVQGSEQRE